MRRQYHSRPSTEGLDVWDVHRLVELSRPLPVRLVDLAGITDVDTDHWDLRQRATVRTLLDHMRLVLDVDRGHPIILAPDGRVMDGMHRVCRALLEGDETIAAVRFEELPPPDHQELHDVSDLSYEEPW